MFELNTPNHREFEISSNASHLLFSITFLFLNIKAFNNISISRWLSLFSSNLRKSSEIYFIFKIFYEVLFFKNNII